MGFTDVFAGDYADAGQVRPQAKDDGPTVKSFVSRWFAKQGRIVATYPKTVIFCCIVVAAAFCAGLTLMKINSDPESIWVPPGSKTSRQQDTFNDVFDPFYRINQVIVTLKPEAQEYYNTTNILQRLFLEATLPLQQAIVDATYTDHHSGKTYTLQDYCFEPIRGRDCMYQTPLDFWRSNSTRISLLDYTTIQEGIACKQVQANGTSVTGCMSNIGVPVLPDAVLGGTSCVPVPGLDGQSLTRHLCHGGCDTAAEALMITFLLNDMDYLQDGAKVWEKEVFLHHVERFNANNAKFDPATPASALSLSYMAQRSVADELVVVEEQNKLVVLFSYVAMFAYIILALGKFPHPLRSRASLGFQGIIIVACSVGVSIGIVSYFGMAITMIVTEVVPFLILAIGVDNMFIISKTWDKREETHPMESVPDRASAVLAEVGPTITSAAISECLAFAVGASTDIPALQGFCVVAALAVFVDYALQITWFVAAVSLDARRVAAGRMDIAPCVQLERDACSTGGFWTTVLEGKFVRKFMKRVWAPMLMNPFVKAVVVLAWVGFLAGSVLSVNQMKLGLEQNLVLPTGSYLSTYFDQQATLGEAGAPAYVVLQNVNYTHPDTPAAVDTIVRGLTTHSNVIDKPVYDWYSRFLTWDSKPTYDYLDDCISAGTCPSCRRPLTHNHTFARRVQQFLYAIDLTSECCQAMSYCGAQYASDVKFLWGTDKVTGEPVPLEVMHSRLRTQHTTTRNQADFIRDMQTTQHVVEELAKQLPTVDLSLYHLHHVTPPPTPLPAPLSPADADGADGADGAAHPTPLPLPDNMHYNWVKPAPGGNAFAYSLFYVYYEQYNYIRGIALQNVLLALGAVFVAALVISSPAVSIFVVVCVASVAIDLVGFLYCLNPPKDNDPAVTHIYSVDINAVSVVNLVMAIGLAVEFCVHIATAFMDTQGTRNERAVHAVVEMGSSVVTGITLTKFVGVLVLAWAPSTLFRLYYFRMYCGIIVCGFFHGLMFLPVALSLVGPDPTDPRKRLSNATEVEPLLSHGAEYGAPASRRRDSDLGSLNSGTGLD